MTVYRQPAGEIDETAKITPPESAQHSPTQDDDSIKSQSSSPANPLNSQVPVAKTNTPSDDQPVLGK